MPGRHGIQRENRKGTFNHQSREGDRHSRDARRQGVDLTPTTTERAPRTTQGPRIPEVEGNGRPLSPDELLRLVEELNQAYEAGLLDEDEFEEKKLILMDRV